MNDGKAVRLIAVDIVGIKLGNRCGGRLGNASQVADTVSGLKICLVEALQTGDHKTLAPFLTTLDL